MPRHAEGTSAYPQERHRPRGQSSPTERRGQSQEPPPSASPGAGLGSILGRRAGDAEASPVGERRWTATGSSHMTGEQDVKLYMYDLSKGLAKVLSPMLGSWWSKTPSAEDFDGVWHCG